VVVSGGWRSLTAGDAPARGLLNMTTIPSSGEQVPCVGLGTVDFQADPSTPGAAPLRETLQAFHRLGGRLLDTSPNYGIAEDVLGQLLTDLGIREDMFMATKVDREDRAAGEARLESSFQRLRGPIELMQVHNLRGADALLPLLASGRRRGASSTSASRPTGWSSTPTSSATCGSTPSTSCR
jgi:aryl-alcohol dehydrogenase-like predicted oxidoreductase